MGHILRKEDSFLARKMLMRMQKPYEEGSILLDAPQHDTMNELAELAKDKEKWQGTANAICPAKRLNTAVCKKGVHAPPLHLVDGCNWSAPAG